MRGTVSSWRSLAARRTLTGTGAALLAAAVTACTGGGQVPANPVAPGTSATVTTTVATNGQGGEMVSREVRGTLSGRFDFTRTWGSEWWQFYSDSDVTGTLIHLGLSRMFTTHIPNLETGALDNGTFKIVAANGDQIVGTFTGTAAYDPVRADVVHGTATFVVSGGTGRFGGATGSFNATALETLDDPSWMSAKVAWTLDGAVKY